MSAKVMLDLRLFEKTKPALLVEHPLYDNFGSIISKSEARKYLNLDETDKIILFFGFIRKYKGLDLLLEAMHILQSDAAAEVAGLKLLIAGEFYDDEKYYLELISKWNLQHSVLLKTGFIPDKDVPYYFCAADAVVQPYRNATQSGVTPLSYHFEKPMIVTNVGGLPALVPHRKTGLVTEADPTSIAASVREFYQLGESYFIPHLRNEKQKFSWQNIVKAVMTLAKPRNN
jgi:glycosyltransferase involved in cell wall biosynthesis